MCEDKGTRGEDGTAESARVGIGWKEEVVVPVVQWMIKWEKVMRNMLAKAHFSVGANTWFQQPKWRLFTLKTSGDKHFDQL